MLELTLIFHTQGRFEDCFPLTPAGCTAGSLSHLEKLLQRDYSVCCSDSPEKWQWKVTERQGNSSLGRPDTFQGQPRVWIIKRAHLPLGFPSWAILSCLETTFMGNLLTIIYMPNMDLVKLEHTSYVSCLLCYLLL